MGFDHGKENEVYRQLTSVNRENYDEPSKFGVTYFQTNPNKSGYPYNYGNVAMGKSQFTVTRCPKK
jgi:hypothetical protein